MHSEFNLICFNSSKLCYEIVYFSNSLTNLILYDTTNPLMQKLLLSFF